MVGLWVSALEVLLFCLGHCELHRPGCELARVILAYAFGTQGRNWRKGRGCRHCRRQPLAHHRHGNRMADSALSLPQCRVRKYQCYGYDEHTHSDTPQNKGKDVLYPFEERVIHDYLRRKCDTDHAAASSDAAVMTVGRRPKQYTASGAMNVSQAMAIVNRKLLQAFRTFSLCCSFYICNSFVSVSDPLKRRNMAVVGTYYDWHKIRYAFRSVPRQFLVLVCDTNVLVATQWAVLLRHCGFSQVTNHDLCSRNLGDSVL